MALNGETVWWADAWTGNSTYTATWMVDFPPAAVMAKVSPALSFPIQSKQTLYQERCNSLPAGLAKNVIAISIAKALSGKAVITPAEYSGVH